MLEKLFSPVQQLRKVEKLKMIFDCIMKVVPHSDGLHQPVFQLQQAAVFSDDKLTVRCLYAACLTMNS